jgi:LacI family transcriptional regulator, repressor for deo operon, udp, cdd, tsx, nupC, and nupG
VSLSGAAGSPVGILDVARRAGVSPSTVSRSLRGSARVSAATRDRVLRAAAELEYVPDPAASRLASGRTSAVGVIMPFATRWFFTEVLTGIEEPLRAAGYDLLLYNIGDPTARDQFFDAMPLRRRVDAVLTVASAFGDREQAALGALGVPLAVVGGHVSGFPRVGIDDRAGAATAVRHLLLLGHRDIAMISGDPGDAVGRRTTSARRAGFEDALAEAGIGPDPERVVSEPWGVTGGIRAMEQLLGRRRLPTAVFAESDEMALGALQTLRRAGLEVPGRVSVIGFDDHEMAPAGDLTTIAQPAHRQGELAARLLLEVLAGGSPSAGDVTLPTRLVVRGSTGPPPAGAAGGRAAGSALA